MSIRGYRCGDVCLRERASGYGSWDVIRLRSSAGRESKGDVMFVVVAVVLVVIAVVLVVIVVAGFAIGCAPRRLGWNAK